MNTRIINGVDIIDINRVQKIMMERRDTLINKFFTSSEKKYIKSKNFREETIAGLFAAKEAISKALGSGLGPVGFKDIEIQHTNLGKPIVNLSDEVKSKYNISYMEVSISHEKRYAIAFAIGEIYILSEEGDYE